MISHKVVSARRSAKKVDEPNSMDETIVPIQNALSSAISDESDIMYYLAEKVRMRWLVFSGEIDAKREDLPMTLYIYEQPGLS